MSFSAIYNVGESIANGLRILEKGRAHALHATVAMALVIATIFRAMMSFTLHMWYAWNQTSDDQLLMSYSFHEHFAADNALSLAKNPGYGYWIALCSKLGLIPDLCNFLVWLIAAAMMSAAMWHVFHKAWLSIAAYLYVLWNPLAFENWLGTRIYRNSLFVPMFFILLAMLVLYMTWFESALRGEKTDQGKSAVHTIVIFVVIEIATGLLFAFLYILKEDSAWMIPMFLFCIGYAAFTAIRNFSKADMQCVVAILALFPLLVACAGIECARNVNYHYFGVRMLNTRTEGELDGFLRRVYSIDNSEQSAGRVWAPMSSFEKAVGVSPTLRKNPEFLKKFKTSGFVEGKGADYVIRGDLVAWQLRIAVSQSIGWSSEQDVQRYFTQVNKDLDRAFQQKRLHKSKKIMMLSSVVPRSSEEISALIKPTFVSWTWGIDIASQFNTTKNRNQSVDSYAKTNPPQRLVGYLRSGLNQLHIDASSPNPEYFRFFTFKDAQKVATIMAKAYTLFNSATLAMIICLLGFRIIRRKWRNAVKKNLLVLALLLVLYPLAYCFSVNWFAEYVHNPYVIYFYTAGATVPMMATVLLLGAGTIVGRTSYCGKLFVDDFLRRQVWL